MRPERRWRATAVTVALLCGLVATPVSAQADPVAAADMPAATELEKVKAVNEIEVGEATPEWRNANDMDFVFKVYDRVNAENFPFTREESYRVYRIMVDTPAAPDATSFIRTGIFDFAQRDRVERQRRNEERNRAVQARREAAQWAEIPVDDDMLGGTDQNFVYRVFQRAKAGSKVKAGALEAWGGEAPEWKAFISTRIYALHSQDQQDAIDDAAEQDQERGRKLASDYARKNAGAKIPLTILPAWLELTDDNFIRELLRTAELADPVHQEIRAAAVAALASSSRDDWKRFIDTGVAEARARDDARILREREEADRRLVRDIKAKAEASRLRPRLAAAAAAVAANGTWEEVKDFLARGQYMPLEQSLEGVTVNTRGWYVRSTGGDAWATGGTVPGSPVAPPLGWATWRMVPGLADPNCFSLESSQLAGSYLRVSSTLRVQLAAADGSDQFKRTATWCALAPKSGGSDHVTLESKSSPGRFLRQYWGELWAANGQSSQNNFDTTGNFATDASWKVVEPNPRITTQIMFKYLNNDGWRNALGLPVGAETILQYGQRMLQFQGGLAFWGPGIRDPHFVAPPIIDKWMSVGGYSVEKNLPESETSATPDGVGRFNHFENGKSIYWSPGTGAHLVYGAIRQRWSERGWEQGYLGYPITDELTAVGQPNLRRSMFQYGNIDHDLSTGVTRDYRR
ncbi:hypothetical protein JOF56_008525 [Kibdelosporangium banguiense]|uniref:Alpha-L-arabinofuranosidase B arabinose-binding domain-containing protein n=1 Tax=Kibdelosporangium banguiense TaxID=1365924 RepID=A0ABS4TUR1_9PSEU|nr:AbfB domain-containing protein [Kibdelosporangium banguiense]MBP2328140.1 hypothetical protein [Kibdelosporangium banguiense]